VSAAGKHLSYRSALSSIEAGRLARVYVLWGDSYLVGKVLAALRRVALPGGEDFDLVRMDGAAASAAEVGQAARTAPFSGGKRLLIVERARFLRPRSPARGAGGAGAGGAGVAGRPSVDEGAAVAEEPADGQPGRLTSAHGSGGAGPGSGDDWERAFAELPPTAAVVLLPEGAPDSRLRLVKLISAYGGMVECQASGRDAQALASEVLRATAVDLGVKIDWRGQSLLIATVGTDCGALVQELHKLSLYCGARQVTERDIMSLCPRTAEADIWQLLDAIEAADPGEALRIARAALGRGESAVALIASLASQVRIMARARERTLAGVQPRALAEVLGANRFWVEQSLRRAQQFSLSALYRSLQELARLDLAIKTGQLEPDAAVETYVLGLAAARSPAVRRS
jgi:DNA polymerase-3 subunit delta